MKNKDIYIYLKDITLINLFTEIKSAISKKFHLNFKAIEDPIGIKEKSSLICDSLSIQKLLKNNIVEINCYMIDLQNNNSVIIESINNIAVFNIPLKIIDFFSQIKNDQINIENKIKDIIKFKNFFYDFRNRRIFNSSKELKFTEKENEIFLFLLDASDKPVTKKMILENVWSYNSEIDTHTLETHIYLIRRKIHNKLSIIDAIINEEDTGYRLITKKF